MPTDPPAARRSRIAIAAQVLALAAAALGGWGVVRQWSELTAVFARFSAGTLAGGAVLALATGLLGEREWSYFARSLGADAPWRVLARVFFIGQLGKYLPGPGWPALLQGSLGGAAGQPVAATSGAAVICMALTPVVGLPVGLLLVLAGAPARAGELSWLLLLLPPLLALLHPAVFRRTLDVALRLARRKPLAVRIRTAHLLVGCCWHVALWAAVAGQAALLTRGTGVADPVRTMLLAAGAAVVAYCVGMFAVIMPAGLGVREGAMVALLGPVIGVAPALAVALCCRVLQTGSDLVLAGLALAARTRRAAARPDGDRVLVTVAPVRGQPRR